MIPCKKGGFNIIYLDYSATSPVLPAAAAEFMRVCNTAWGNPSSQHALGKAAAAELENARSVLSGKLGCLPENIIFTSGGTESNNLAVLGTAKNYGRRKKHIITTSLEHASISQTIKTLTDYDVTVIPPESDGRISSERVMSAVCDDTFLISVTLVCNETGAINPVSEIAEAASRRGIILHTDAVQAFGNIPVDVKKLGVGLLSVSGHKIGSTRGIGALYKASEIRLSPILSGGQQENKLRAGTEFTAGAASLAVAVKASRYMDNTIKDYALEKLNTLDNIVIIQPHDAPNILMITVKTLPGEVCQRILSDREIYVSTGSACNKGRRSEALTTMKIPSNLLGNVLRISFSSATTTREIDEFVKALGEISSSLV